MIKKWKKKSSKYLLENKIFKMREDLVTSPKLKTDHNVWVMEVPTWVNIIPITPQNDVVLVDQYRFGSEKSSLEIPGGMVDPGEDPMEAAIRELLEETGFVGKDYFFSDKTRFFQQFSDSSFLRIFSWVYHSARDFKRAFFRTKSILIN